MLFFTEAVVFSCNEFALRNPVQDSTEATFSKQDPLFFFNSPVRDGLHSMFYLRQEIFAISF
eukprot:m.499903 g.499903  ORF g.499903 m.499903 type:complete len:62 (-) comp21828_c0_seq21:2106-2291(-)